ncbi:MAG: CinA family protein [Clostridia bacterium]|nr:CinA family protein [Clostridia bacterium]
MYQRNPSAALRACAKNAVRQLAARGETLSTAESCTGGLIAKSVTDIAGSSAVFLGGCVTYTNEIKTALLGVDPALIARVSEVSFDCAKAMASGARARLGTTYALSTTGYAGPGGGTERDPVGTVYLALATPDGVLCERFSAPAGASRTQVRTAAAMRALEMLERQLKQ